MYEDIGNKDKKINAFITLDKEKAVKPLNRGKLSGLRLGIKDNIAVKGLRMTCGSKMLENYIAPYNATVIERILNEGGEIVGKCNMDEFACGSDGTTSAFGPTRNPRDPERVPGGSSSGSAAAIAAGFVDASLGSDTGGSIRCPANFCGVVGLKPTYGLVSRYGLADLAMSLEGIGPMGKDVHSVARLLEVIAGCDPKDNVTSKRPVQDYSRLDGTVRGMTFGVPKEFFDGLDSGVDKQIQEAVGKLEDAGMKKHKVSIPSIKYAVPTYFLTVFSEFSSAMSKYDGLKYGFSHEDADLFSSVSGSRNQAFGKEIKRRILLGTYITMKEYRGNWYTKALKSRSIIRKEFLSALEKCDVLVGPTVPSPPWKIGEMENDPLKMYLSDILTVGANLAGIPAGVVPVGKTCGLQVIGDYFEEKKILNIMYALERKL